MQQQDKAPRTGAPATAAVPNGAAEGMYPEVADLLGKVEPLLREGQIEKALELLSRAKIKSSWLTSALGVCQLRLGNVKTAVDLYRGMVLSSGGLLLRKDVPAVFKTNYAVALFLSSNVSGCQTVLSEVNDETLPAVKKLREAIRRWERSMGFWQRLNWWTGGTPDHPVVLDFPPEICNNPSPPTPLPLSTGGEGLGVRGLYCSRET